MKTMPADPEQSTINPNPANPRSSHPAEQHRHPATGPRVLVPQRRIQSPRRVPPHRFLPRRAATSLRSGTWATIPGAASPIPRADRATASATLSHRWCSAWRAGPRLGLSRSSSCRRGCCLWKTTGRIGCCLVGGPCRTYCARGRQLRWLRVGAVSNVARAKRGIVYI